MKLSKFALVLFGLGMVALAFLSMIFSSKIQDIIADAEPQRDSTIVPAAAVRTSDLILVEFFAGY